jgi:hypothetical protein
MGEHRDRSEKIVNQLLEFMITQRNVRIAPSTPARIQASQDADQARNRLIAAIEEALAAVDGT